MPLKRGREASLVRIAILQPVIEKGGVDQIQKCFQENTQQHLTIVKITFFYGVMGTLTQAATLHILI